MAYKSRIFTRLIACLLLCICFAGYSFSQSSTLPEARQAAPPLRLITAANGFPENPLRSIVQDDAGFMWIATNGSGLVRYDGKNTRLFTHTEGDSSTLASNAIWNLYKDRLNRLWVIHDYGYIDLFDPITEKVRHLSADIHLFQEASARLKTSNPVILPNYRTTFEDRQHRLWLILGNFPTRIDASGNGSVLFLPRVLKNEDLPVSFNETPDGHLLITTNDYIQELDGQFKEVRRTPLPVKSFGLAVAENYTPSYSLLQNDTLYTGAQWGINVYHVRTGQVFFRGGIPQTAIRAPMVVSPKNNRFLFYDTVTTHLYQYTTGDPGFADLGRYVYTDKPGEIYNRNLLFYYYDKWGGLWHAYKNLFYSITTSKPFIVVKGMADGINQFVKHFYNSIAVANTWNETDLDYPWVASSSNATYIIDSTRKLHLMAPASAMLDAYKGDRKWRVIFTGSIYNGLLSDNRFDASGNLWVSDWKRKEIFTIDTIGRVRSRPLNKPGSFAIQSIAAAQKGGCWVVFIGEGLALYSLEKGLVKSFVGKTGANRLPETSLLNMVRDGIDNNIIWINTISSGIVRFNEREETFQILTERDGWPSNSIMSPTVDSKGFLWYQTTTGVYRYDTQKKHHLLVVDSARYKTTNWEDAVCVLMGKNQLWFSNQESRVLIDGNKVGEVRNVATMLTGIKINNQSIRDGDTALVPDPLNTVPELRLAYNQNFLSLQFAALSYAQPGQIRYRYQMVGLDKDWIDNGGNDVAQYPSLPAGHYTFKVNATNEDGNWSSEVKTIQVVISPPWWRTWWMYTIYGLLLVGAIYLFITIRLRRLQLHQQVVLKQKEAEQAQALEETKSRFFANITHELRTPLTLILSPVQRQLQEGAGTYTPLLQGVYQNSQTLLRLINQLLDMSKLEGGNMPVTFSRGDIDLFVESIVTTFNRPAQAKDIRLSYETSRFGGEYLFDSDKLEKILYNLLSNAFKFTPEGGNITVAVHQQKKLDDKVLFTFRIADSGVGIPPEHLPHIFNRFYQVNTSTIRKYEGTGIGLSLVKEFTELMGGTITVDSQPGNGSIFTLSLLLAVATGTEPATIVAKPQLTIPSEQITNPTESIDLQNEDRPLVLIADDNEELRNFISASLLSHYRVITAVNGEDGLQKAMDELPELIISDVMMPVIDGYEFCQKVKENPLTSHIGFILLTAKTANESRVSGLRLGADHYIGKPFMVEELLLVTGNLLKRQQKLRDFYHKQLQQPAEKLQPVAAVEDPFLQSVYAVIETHLDSDRLDVDFLASEMAVSRRTLNRKLAAVADTSANELIRSYRLEKAAELLMHGEAVSNAAYATGFSTPSYFSQCFKEMYGQSPVQWVEGGGMSQN